jgi:putative peptidoglycan lipid II flippase
MSLGMGGYGVQNILSRAYFAKQNGRAPLIAGAVSIGANILLCMALVGRFEVAGLAVASAASSTLYALLLLLPMVRRGEKLLDRAGAVDLVKMLAASVFMGLCAYGVLSLLTAALPSGKLGELVSLGGSALAGLAVYFLLALALGLQEAKLTVNFVKRLKRG